MTAIEDLAIIGNCQYSALIDRNASVQWLCWPRFDSSFVFGNLLDKEKGGVFQIAPAEPASGESAYLPNTNVLRTVFRTASGSFEVIDFAPRYFQNDRYHKPTSLIRIVRRLSDLPLVRVACRPMGDYGRVKLVPTVVSNHIHYSGGEQAVRLTTNASLTMIMEERPFVLDETLYFVLTWGRPFDLPLKATCDDYLDRTVRYWQTWVKHCHLPAKFQGEVIRSALALKLHQFEDTGAITAATTTSIPEAAGTGRNWDYRFCWLRDAHFSLDALRKLSHFDELESFISFLTNIVAFEQNVLQPVYSISGDPTLGEYILAWLDGYRGNKPVRVGNLAYEQVQNDLYGEMILSLSPLFLDLRFLGDERRAIRNLLEQLMGFIEAHWDKPDAGIWEFRGIAQVHTFSLLLHWAGAVRAVDVAKRAGWTERARRWQELADKIEAKIRTECWNASIGAYTQAVGTDHLDASLLMMVNLGFLRQSDPAAASHVKAIVDALGTPSGLLRRYVRLDDFGETHNIFTVCSFWLAEAYGRLGQSEAGEAVFTKLLDCANSFGLFSEDLDPANMQLWGNFPQTYSHVGLINAAFALYPDY